MEAEEEDDGWLIGVVVIRRKNREGEGNWEMKEHSNNMKYGANYPSGNQTGVVECSVPNS
jgi:hypothetical protein